MNTKVEPHKHAFDPSEASYWMRWGPKQASERVEARHHRD